MKEKVNSKVLEYDYNKLCSLTPEQRNLRIVNSQKAAKLKQLKNPAAIEYVLSGDDFSKKEKKYILFNISNLERICKMKFYDFQAAVELFNAGKKYKE